MGLGLGLGLGLGFELGLGLGLADLVEVFEEERGLNSNAVKSAVGGGSLEHPRRWLGTQGLGAQWLGLTLGVLSCPEPPGVP